jgi:cytidylate kinase
MGTVVFPEAEFKVYLTASAEERAERRYKQLKQKGIESKLSQLIAEISERDQRDSQRSVAPLKPADDAFMVDSTGLNIEMVYQQVRDYCTATK